jgi:NTP pyrophosphatase (non-canonical NTP hydrolase)
MLKDPIDLNKKYVIKNGYKVDNIKKDEQSDNYVYRFFKNDIYGFITCNKFGQCIPNLNKNFLISNFSDYDLVEISGYHEGNIDKEFQEEIISKYPDIEDYVQEKTLWFSKEVFKKLMDNAYKGKWDGYSIEWMFEKLIVEMAELYNSIVRYNNENDYYKIIRECADVSAFVEIIADLINMKYKRINNEK